MRFATSSVVIAVAALASSVQGRAAPAAATSAAAPATTNAPVSGAANAITFPLGDKPLEAGKPVTIKWTPNFGDKVTLSLRKGSDTDNLDNLVDIAVDVDNSGSLTWTPPSDLEAGGDYAIEIVSGASANYSPQFSVDSNGNGLSTTKSSASTATSGSSSTKTASATKTTSTSTSTDDVSSTASASKTKTASDEDASSEPTSSADASSEPDASSTPTDTAATTDISAPEETGAADSGAAAGIARSPLAFMVGLVAVLAFFH